MLAGTLGFQCTNNCTLHIRHFSNPLFSKKHCLQRQNWGSLCPLAGQKEISRTRVYARMHTHVPKAMHGRDLPADPQRETSSGAHTRTPFGVIMHFTGEMGHSKPKLPLIAHIEQNGSDFSASSWGECRHLPSGSQHDCVCHCSEASQHNIRCGSFCHCISQRVILKVMLLHTTSLLSCQKEPLGFENNHFGTQSEKDCLLEPEGDFTDFYSPLEITRVHFVLAHCDIYCEYLTVCQYTLQQGYFKSPLENLNTIC